MLAIFQANPIIPHTVFKMHQQSLASSPRTVAVNEGLLSQQSLLFYQEIISDTSSIGKFSASTYCMNRILTSPTKIYYMI